MNRRNLFLAGAVLFLVLAVWRLAFVHTEERKTEILSALPASEISNAHHLSWPRELPLPASITSPSVTNEPPVNAADIYRKAFALFDALPQDEKKALGDWKAEVDPSVEAELCGKLKPIVALAHEAAAVTNCDWEANRTMVSTNLAQMNAHALEMSQSAGRARALARTMVWNVAHCRQNDSVGVGDDLADTLRIAQSLSQGFLGYLTDTAIQLLAMDCLAANAASLPSDVSARLEQLFDDDQYEESFYRALESDAEMKSRRADKIAAMPPEEAQNALQQRWGEGPVPPTFQAQFIAATRQIAELEREYAGVLSLPEAHYQAWLDKLHAAEQADPIIASEWSGLDNIVDISRAAVVQRAMVSAGLALIQNGPGALQNHLDPASGGAFVYHQTANGFELESTYQRNDKPVVMSFRNP